jgi:pseudaminic acid biosynthesis-associated methylase
MIYKTEQEHFWAGEFGIEYAERNEGERLVASNLALFSNIIQRTYGVKSVIEFGSNIGLNLRALRRLLPDAQLSAIELNQIAIEKLKSTVDVQHVYHQSILDFECDFARDFVLIKGVLIHIDPEYLCSVYEKLFQTSVRYICIAEYYNPTPVALPYRGHENKLFKRDFAGEIMDQYRQLKLVDYGFVYRRDTNFPADDINWFLLEKLDAS